MDFLATVDNELDVRMKSIAGQITYICITYICISCIEKRTSPLELRVLPSYTGGQL